MNINILLIIVFSIIVITLLIFLYFNYLNNKIDYTMIRINEADNRIEKNLKEKYELLNRSISLIKEKVKEENILKEIVKLRSRKVSNSTLNQILNDSYIEFNDIFKKHKELNKSDELDKIRKQIIVINNELDTLKSYYNGNINYYNKMLKRIPTNIVAKIKKYRIKEYLDYLEENN